MRVGESLSFVIGGANEHVTVTVVGRERAASDYWDGNWLVTPIEIVVGHFRGTLGADLRAEEIRRFRVELESLYANVNGQAVLDSLDGWITMTVTCQPNGSLVIEGAANDQPGIGNELRFSLSGLDQSYLPPLIEALKAVEAEYPVIGAP